MHVNKNDIVFHNKFGFGVVIKNDDVVLDIKFYLHTSIKTISTNYVMLVNKEFINLIADTQLEDLFDNWVIRKSIGYLDRVDIVKYNNDTISSFVFGNEQYSTSMIIKRNRITFSCDCPVNGHCKHEAALFEYVKDILLNLTKNTYSSLKRDIIESIEKIQLGTSVVDNTMYVCTYIKKHLSLEYLMQIFDVIKLMNKDYYLSDDFNNLVYCILSYKPTRILISKNIDSFKKYSFFSQIKEALYMFESIKESFLPIKSLYCFANDDYRGCLMSSFANFDFRYREFIEKACEKVQIDNELFKELKKSISQNGKGEIYRKLIYRLSSDKIIDLIKNNCIMFSYKDISFKDKKDRIALLPYVTYDMSDVEIMVKEDLKNIKDDKTKAFIICGINRDKIGYRQKAAIISALKKIKNSEYLQMYINNDFCYNIENNGYTNERYIFTLKANEDFGIDEKQFFSYFKIDYSIIKRDDLVEIRHQLKKINDEVILDVAQVNDNYVVLFNDFDGQGNSCYARYIISYNNHKHSKDITQKYKILESELNKEIDNRKSDLALNKIKQFRIFDKKSIKLNEGNKASIIYYFDNDFDSYTVSLKIGINKYYTVKDIRRFINNFIDESTEEYGKNFLLTHSIDNFVENDAKILQELLKTEITCVNRNNIRITSYMFDYFMDNLINRTIYYKKQAYLVRMNKLDCSFTIDSDYRLQINNFENISNMLFSYKRMYFINKETNTIDYFEGNFKDIYIYSFLISNIGTNIKPLLQEFKENIYYDYSDKIEVVDSIKKDFIMSNVIIKAYFDYDDSIINCKSIYYIDDKEISLNAIKEKYNLDKIDRFNEYIKNLGFINNIMDNEGDILNFFLMDFSNLKKYCEVYLSENIQNKKVTTFTPGKIQIKHESNIMKAFLENSQYSDEELYKVLVAVKKKKRFIIMEDNNIIDLSSKEVVEFNNVIDELGLNKKKISEETSLPIAKVLKAFAYQNDCDIDDYLLNMINDISNFKNANIKIPDVKAKLRDYQKEGYYWLSILSKYKIGGILADDMGLGKTLQTILLIASSNEIRPNLIVCPKSVIFNWLNEFGKFAPSEKVNEIYGTKEQRKSIIKSISDKSKITYIVSYDSLRSDIDLYINRFNYLILDEAQNIKNVTAQKTHNVKKINAEHRFALTGTPIENNIIDLWSVFDFIIPGYFEKIDLFKSKYNSDPNYIHIIAKRVAPFILRRTKKDVLKDLPEKYEHIVSSEMSASQRKIYDAYIKNVKDKMQDGLNAFEILPYLTRLRQICIDPKIFIDNFNGDSGKLDMLRQLIIDYIDNGHKIMIVSQFVQALNSVEQILKELKILYFMITGSVEAKERIEICNKFNNDSEEKIILVSLKAGGTGINLTGADVVIHLDPWWNTASTDQATDRTYRIGQKRNVEVIKLICDKSIEQRVIELQNIKKDLIDKVISDNDSSVVNTSIEDIRFILD